MEATLIIILGIVSMLLGLTYIKFYIYKKISTKLIKENVELSEELKKSISAFIKEVYIAR